MWLYFTQPEGTEHFFLLIAQGFVSITLFILPPIYVVLYLLIPRYLIKRKHFAFALSTLLTALIFGYFIGHFEPLVDKYLFDQEPTQIQPSYGIVVITFLLVVTVLLNLSYRWFIQLSVMKQMENDHLRKELSLLKNQINPHFFFNTLNNLYALALEKSNETPAVILKLSQLMRYSIYDCKGPFVEIEKEIAYIENYIALQQIRKLDTQIEFKKQVNDQSLKIAPLILIVLLENAFKHGVDSMPNGAFVMVRLEANKSNVEFQVSNNFNANNNQSTGGLGLENVTKRLDLIYGKSFNFTTVEKDEVFIATLKIKLS
ncbi:sensor histidine kinase [Fulvivirga aurantia]|uniref:sensor histidine kinase n=1 Tax=Fulvivirga aurantia TaxID=2529383 RepID=UPI001624B22D|nr:sensor histidine kinase [Fulvivirga aurantia]